MRKFKEGQQVWWNDPADETSGEYKVLDPKDEYNSDTAEEDIVDFDDRIILIGNGVSEAEVYAEELEILNPLSSSEMEQVEALKNRSQSLRQELIKKMEEVTAQCNNQTLSVKGYSCKTCDDDHNPCCASEFSLRNGVLYVILEYNDKQENLVPVANRRLSTQRLTAFHSGRFPGTRPRTGRTSLPVSGSPLISSVSMLLAMNLFITSSANS